MKNYTKQNLSIACGFEAEVYEVMDEISSESIWAVTFFTSNRTNKKTSRNQFSDKLMRPQRYLWNHEKQNDAICK